MSQIKVTKDVGGIEGLCIIEPTVHGDNRGYFMETYNQKDMQSNGLNMVFVQDNQSCSVKGVLRGLHLQKNFPQGKLVRVIKGKIYDVAVDFRKGSKTYLKYYGIELSVLSDIAELCYKVTDFYHPGDEIGIAWNDPKIGIDWASVGVKGEYKGTASPEGYTIGDTPLILSAKDCKNINVENLNL